MNLSDIFCQDKAVNTLQRAYGAKKIPHAYIFAGADGVGKFTTAMRLGQTFAVRIAYKKK